jgi:hypothetical protein
MLTFPFLQDSGKYTTDAPMIDLVVVALFCHSILMVVHLVAG